MIIRLRQLFLRDKLASVANVQRPRTCTHANCSEHVQQRQRLGTRASKWARAAGARKHLPEYVQIHANTVLYVCDTDMLVYYTDM
jgi:hypothetical protein